MGRERRRRHAIVAVGLLVVAAAIAFELRPPPDLMVGGSWNLSLPSLLRSGVFNLVHAIGVSVISVAVLAVTLWWLHRTRTLLLFAVPTGALLLLFSAKYFNVWHEGVLFLLWVFALWIGFQRSREPGERLRLARTAMGGAMVVALLVQLGWSINSVRYDWDHDYSASRAVARYVTDHDLQHRRIAAFGYGSMAILPYFRDDIFINLNGGRGPSYWVWSKRGSGLVDSAPAVLVMDPDLIVVSIKSWDQKPPCLPRYTRKQTFVGALYWKNRRLEPESFLLYARDSTKGAESGCAPSSR